jgi:hypothetical protein
MTKSKIHAAFRPVCTACTSLIQRNFLARSAFSTLGCALVLALFLGTLSTAIASPPGSRDAIVKMDRATFHEQLRSFGYRTRGGIARSLSDSNDPMIRSLPRFSSSFSVNGVTYPYTMLGYPPPSGRTARLRSVIVPLRMKFLGFESGELVFDPKDAVTNIANSPMYKDAQFPNGVGQFGDQLQRATFWNKMDSERRWHVKMAPPRVMRTIDIEVTPETGSLFQISENGQLFGNVLIDFLDAQARTIIQLTGIDADEVPIFVTQNVLAEALGYHTAVPFANSDGGETLQTYIFTSWLDPSLVEPIFADVSTFNHEEGEWLNDPFINNIVPTWEYPPPTDPRATCSDNPLLEVGDPQGNGPTFDDFPTIVVPANGTSYHLQQLVMLPWFADEQPSSAENGWYTFPDPDSIKVPAVYCR